MSEDKNEYLNKPQKKQHGNAKEIDWKLLEALFIPCVSKKQACDFLGISDTHLDNQLAEEFGMTFTEYKEFLLQDAVSSIKYAMYMKAIKGDVSAAKYVLKNMGDWTDSQTLDLGNNDGPVEVTLNYKKKEVAND